MYKKEATSSESSNSMAIPGKGMTTSVTRRTKIPNKKQKAGTNITEIINLYLRKLLKRFYN